jgi:hypothetical protein
MRAHGGHAPFIRLLIVALLCAATSGAPWADEGWIEALGHAPVMAGDRAVARERALEEAMRQAVQQATSQLLTPAQVVARASQLRLGVYPKARNYVATYRVLDEREQPPGTFEISISAQVDTQRLSRALSAGAPQPNPTNATSSSPKHQVTVCAAIKPGDALSAQELEALVARQLKAAAIDPVSATGACTPEEGAKEARGRGTAAAVIAAVELVPAPGEVSGALAIRGTDRVSVRARASLRLVEPDGRVSGEGDGDEDAYDVTRERAALAAARGSLEEAGRTLLPILGSRFAAAMPNGVVAVRVVGARRYEELQHVTRMLAALPGVAGVEPRRFHAGGVDVLVHSGQRASQLAAELSRRAAAGVHLAVRAESDALLVVQVEDLDGNAGP